MDRSNSTPVAETAKINPTVTTKNVVDTLIAAGNFTIFSASLKAATGLTDALAAKGPFTVFAPSDEAFKKLPPGAYDALLKDSGKLKDVLNYHIVPGYIRAKDMKSGEMMTQQGSTLSAAATSSDVRVNEARITRADLVAANGIVHAIDAVILPKDWKLLAAAA